LWAHYSGAPGAGQYETGARRQSAAQTLSGAGSAWALALAG